jgi:hypothetical protein
MRTTRAIAAYQRLPDPLEFLRKLALRKFTATTPRLHPSAHDWNDALRPSTRRRSHRPAAPSRRGLTEYRRVDGVRGTLADRRIAAGDTVLVYAYVQ